MCANSPGTVAARTVTPTPEATKRGPWYLPALMASRTHTSANPGSPTLRTVVTPLDSCCWACLRSVRCRYQRPTGLATTFSIRSPAAPALVGLPLPHRCTCRLTRPGIKYAPFKSTSCAPAGPTVEAAGPTALMRPLSSTATVIFSCGCISRVPSSSVACVNT